jgi:hypothetical protein
VECLMAQGTSAVSSVSRTTTGHARAKAKPSP